MPSTPIIPTPPADRAILDVPMTADYLGVSIPTVQVLVRCGDIKSAKIGKRRLFRRHDIDANMASRGGA
jgi:excisionase family DNA binding protein